MQKCAAARIRSRGRGSLTTSSGPGPSTVLTIKSFCHDNRNRWWCLYTSACPKCKPLRNNDFLSHTHISWRAHSFSSSRNSFQMTFLSENVFLRLTQWNFLRDSNYIQECELKTKKIESRENWLSALDIAENVYLSFFVINNEKSLILRMLSSDSCKMLCIYFPNELRSKKYFSKMEE